MSHCLGSKASGYQSISASSCAWLSVLNPFEQSASQSYIPPRELTLIAINVGIFHHYCSAIESCILLRLSSVLAHIRSILPSRRRNMVGWYSQNMATQKLLRSCKICVKSAGIAIAGGKEDFSCRY